MGGSLTGWTGRNEKALKNPFTLMAEEAGSRPDGRTGTGADLPLIFPLVYHVEVGSGTFLQ